jgi:hypothetical protein
VGCNLEDSGQGVLQDPREHAEWLAEVRAAAGDRLFVNARVDTFLQGVTNPERTIERAALYVAAGADCVDPIGAPADVLPLLRAGIEGPLNALARPAGDGPSPPSWASEGPPGSPSGRACSGGRRRRCGRSRPGCGRDAATCYRDYSQCTGLQPGGDANLRAALTSAVCTDPRCSPQPQVRAAGSAARCTASRC